MKKTAILALSTVLLAHTSFAQHQAANKKLPAPKIAYVQLEREPCEGTCPWYKVVLRPDGKILYFGGGYVEHIGDWRATFWAVQFTNLKRAITARDFASMQSSKYLIVDAPVANITVGYTNGKSKTVTECEMGESLKHWELAKIIDGIVAGANDWQAVKKPKLQSGWQKPGK